MVGVLVGNIQSPLDCVLCYCDMIALKTPKSREKNEGRRYFDYCGITTTEYKWTTQSLPYNFFVSLDDTKKIKRNHALFKRLNGVMFFYRKKTELTNFSDFASSTCYFAAGDSLCRSTFISFTQLTFLWRLKPGLKKFDRSFLKK